MTPPVAATLTVLPLGARVSVHPGQTLLVAAAAAGVFAGLLLAKAAQAWLGMQVTNTDALVENAKPRAKVRVLLVAGCCSPGTNSGSPCLCRWRSCSSWC